MHVLPAAAPAGVRSRVLLFIDAVDDLYHNCRRSSRLGDQQSFAESSQKGSNIAKEIGGGYTLFALFTRFGNTRRDCLSGLPATALRKRFTPGE